MYTQTQLETLEAAIASGVLTVKYADRMVTYQSLESMRAQRDLMKREIASATGGSRCSYAEFSRG